MSSSSPAIPSSVPLDAGRIDAWLAPRSAISTTTGGGSGCAASLIALPSEAGGRYVVSLHSEGALVQRWQSVSAACGAPAAPRTVSGPSGAGFTRDVEDPAHRWMCPHPGREDPQFHPGRRPHRRERVAEVGPGLRARDAELVDATDTIVMPGFVDTHRHAWKSLFRNFGEVAGGDGAGAGGRRRSLPARGRLRRHPDRPAGCDRGGDHHRRRLVAIRPDDALVDAALQAHADAGLRTVFVHALLDRDGGPRQSAPAIRQLVARLDRRGRAARPPSPSGPACPGRSDLGAGRRRLGSRPGSSVLRIHAHAGSETPGAWRDLRRSPSEGSWVRMSRSSTAPRSTTQISTRSRRREPRCRCAVERDGERPRDRLRSRS